MARMTYTADQRTAALVEVERCGGDIVRASLKTGIPERTLYTWRRRFYAESKRQQTPPLPSPITIPTFDDDLESLAYIRQQIMSELVRLASNFQEDNAFATPSQRAIILTQLIDRLIKLDDHLQPYEPSDMVRLPNGKLVNFEIDYDVQPVEDEDDRQHNDEEYQASFYKYSGIKRDVPPSSS